MFKISYNSLAVKDGHSDLQLTAEISVKTDVGQETTDLYGFWLFEKFIKISRFTKTWFLKQCFVKLTSMRGYTRPGPIQIRELRSKTN